MIKKKTATKVEAETSQSTPLVDTAKLAQIIYDETVTWGKGLGLYPKGHKKSKENYTDVALKLDKIINKGNFGCQEPYVRDILEVVLDTKLPPAKKDKDSGNIEYKFGTVLVPLSDPNGKGLPIGEAVLLRNNVGAIVNLEEGASDILLPKSKKYLKAIRLATLNEIEDLLEKFIENTNAATALAVFSLGKM